MYMVLRYIDGNSQARILRDILGWCADLSAEAVFGGEDDEPVPCMSECVRFILDDSLSSRELMCDGKNSGGTSSEQPARPLHRYIRECQRFPLFGIVRGRDAELGLNIIRKPKLIPEQYACIKALHSD